ncbi:MAG TPA: HPF/RaiA family ribosome-associated protein [Gemmataceae bacterium]|nr:HPF/RaiA family ribosome-associated protein [Gemmataceae bacterium]
MKLPLQVSFRNLAHSDAIASLAREKAAKLDRFCDYIMSCRVVIEVPHRHHEHGNLYGVRLDITVPGDEVVVNREPGERTTHRDVGVALRDAFDAAARLLEDYARRRHGLVKAHEEAPHAKVARLYSAEGYGFLATPDGREVYFHEHSVLDGGFKRLAVGTEVTFVEEEGEKGPQASTVRIVGRHHHAAV